MIDNFAIPLVDTFSHTMKGSAWTAHEWLSELLMYLAFRADSWRGLIALEAIAFSITIAYLTRFLLGYLLPVRALLFSVLAIGMAIPHLLARPHLLAMPLLLAWCAGVVRASDEQQTPSPWLLGVMLIWANLHGSFTFGLMFAVAFAVEATLQAGPEERAEAIKKWLTFLALAVIASTLTPQGIQGIFFTEKIMSMRFVQESLGEWLSPNFHKFQFLELWLMLLLVIAMTKGLRLPPIRLLMLLALIHLGLAHVRNVELVGLLSPLLLAAPLAAQWQSFSVESSRTSSINTFFDSLAAPARLPAIAAVLSGLVAISLITLQQRDIHPDPTITPAAALKAAKSAGLKGPVFNDYGFGGYLIFTGIPVYMDGRADLYGDAFLMRALKATNLYESNVLENVLDQYHVQWTLLVPHTPAVALLDHLPHWGRIYADDIAVVHARIEPAQSM